MSKATKSYALRIEAPLVKPLQALKKQNRRSLNAEINAALEAWVAAGAREQTPAPNDESAKPADSEPADGSANTAKPRAPRKRAAPARRKASGDKAKDEAGSSEEAAATSAS